MCGVLYLRTLKWTLGDVGCFRYGDRFFWYEGGVKQSFEKRCKDTLIWMNGRVNVDIETVRGRTSQRYEDN